MEHDTNDVTILTIPGLNNCSVERFTENKQEKKNIYLLHPSSLSCVLKTTFLDVFGFAADERIIGASRY